MDLIKKTGILTGAVVGGLVGGTLSVIGKVAKIKIIDDIGESVVDSTILTGTIAGNLASGTTALVAGKIQHDQHLMNEGVTDLKDTGHKVVNNFVGNVKLVAKSGGEVVRGVKQRNLHKTTGGIKSLVKVVSVGLLTVGAIKIKQDE
ncbi:MAG: hypothetical protein JJE49_00140 [Peptostreptococcaceae bacterium]|nr:hypothetical protein [Peptostreptococcaceae bacterium]